MKVAVLGCGPAGLFACHAAVRGGAEVDVYSQKKRSEIGGAQYLHQHVPDVTGTEPEAMITFAQMLRLRLPVVTTAGTFVIFAK